MDERMVVSMAGMMVAYWVVYLVDSKVLRKAGTMAVNWAAYSVG
jgi:hypothetical protein